MIRKARYGVFQVRQNWKLYTEGEGARTFDDRASAVAAAERAARDDMARGFDVELHVQDVSGEFRQADVVRLAH